MANTTVKKAPVKKAVPKAKAVVETQEVQATVPLVKNSNPKIEPLQKTEVIKGAIESQREVPRPKNTFLPIDPKEDLEIIQLTGGKYELHKNTVGGYKVLKKGSLDKCQNYLNQLKG